MSRFFRRLSPLAILLKPKNLGLLTATSVISTTAGKPQSNNSDIDLEMNGAKTAEELSNAQSSSNNDSPSPVSKALGPLSYGVCMGACAGYASKKATKVAAGLVGVTFIGLQVLQHYGYISVNWLKVRSDVEKKMDQDGDGKFDQRDIEILRRKYMAMLQTSVFAGSGFLAGFAAGFKYA